MPNKTISRPALSQKIPGELSGQPSIKNTKDDLNYWKNREQELLSKIADLESKIPKPQGYSEVAIKSSSDKEEVSFKHNLLSYNN